MIGKIDSYRGDVRRGLLDQLPSEQIHQQPVVPRAVRSLFVRAQHADRSEPDLLVGADRGRVVGRRIDREPMVTALLDQVPGEHEDRLRPETFPVP